MKAKIFITTVFVAPFMTMTACNKSDKQPQLEKNNSQQQKVIAPNVVYGPDNRLDLFEVSNEAVLTLARSTVALVKKNQLDPFNDGSFALQSSHYGEQYDLCSDERFFDQHTAAFCSGFLVHPEYIITAGHCMKSTYDCNNTRFIFDFALHAPGVLPEVLEKNEVYSCESIVHSVQQSNGSDFAVIKLDRPVLGRMPLTVRRSGLITEETPLMVIGHPSGLPTKVAGGASVRKVQNDFFVANLDTYGGNSGSAVFNAISGEVEGILVRGDTDYVRTGGCRRSKTCDNKNCRGEDVTHITKTLSFFPEYEFDSPEDSNPQTPTQETASFSSQPSLAIPDKNPNGIVDELTIGQAPQGRKVFVEVNITHTYRGDLKVSLVDPQGTIYVLHNRSGKGADNIVGTYGLDLEAYDSLAGLSSISSGGKWKIIVSDLASLDVGVLNSWAVHFAP